MKILTIGTAQTRTSQKGYRLQGWRKALEELLAELGIEPSVSGSWESQGGSSGSCQDIGVVAGTLEEVSWSLLIYHWHRSALATQLTQPYQTHQLEIRLGHLIDQFSENWPAFRNNTNMRKLQGDRFSVKYNFRDYELSFKVVGVLSLQVYQLLIGHYFLRETGIGTEGLYGPLQP